MIVDPSLAGRIGIPQNSTGKVIALEAGHGPLQPIAPGTYGLATIFDAVGNIVKKDLPIKRFKTDERNYFIFWDGTNRAGRNVAAGGYLLRVIVTYVNEPEKQVRLQTKFLLKRKSGAL